MAKSADEGHSASQPRKHRHSADRERGRGRPVHCGSPVPPPGPPVSIARSPSPTPSRKHRRLDDTKESAGSYVMQYKKHQQYSPRTDLPRTAEPPRTRLPVRPCIKYQPDTPEILPPPTDLPRCHQLLAEMEPALMDEQPLTDVDPLPPLSDHELYFDSLDERSHDGDRKIEVIEPVLQPIADETAAQDQPETETDVPSADASLPSQKPDDSSNANPDTLSATEDEPITESVPTKEAEEQVVPEAATPEDTESVVPEVTAASEVPPSEDDEAVTESSVENVEEERPPDVDVQEATSQLEDDEVLVVVFAIF